MAKQTNQNRMNYPADILAPVRRVLREQLKTLKKRQREVEETDPFENESRINDNASPDADAEEQFGHDRYIAIKEQIDRKIIQTRKALARIKVGEYGICEDCGEMIDTDRLMIYPEVTLCIKCEQKAEKSS
jgi:DnaK suppressor protein